MTTSTVSMLCCNQGVWRQWRASSEALMSTWAAGGDAVEDNLAVDLADGSDDNDGLVSSVSQAVMANLEARGAAESEDERAAVASGFRIALDALEALFRGSRTAMKADEATPPKQRSVDPRVTSHVSPTAPASSIQPSPQPLSHATTQVDTLSGVVLSMHIMEKCALRLRVHRLERRIAEVVSDREELGRELIRVAASSRLMPSLLMHPGHLAVDVHRLSSSGDRRRHKASKLIWSMISTWQRLSREAHSVQPQEEAGVPGREGDPLVAGDEDDDGRLHRPQRVETRLCSSTFELLNGWLDAVSVYGLDGGAISGGGMRSSESIAAAGVVSAGRSSSSGRLLRCLEDDDDDLTLALAGGNDLNDPAISNSYGGASSRPITRTATTIHGGGGGRMSVNPVLEERGVYMPIFLCRRCRADGRGGMSYDVERQQLFRGKQQQHSHHAPICGGGGDEPQSQSARHTTTVSELPPPPRSPRLRLPHLPAVASPRMHSHGGGLTSRPAYQRHWHSSSKGVFVGRRHDLVYQ